MRAIAVAACLSVLASLPAPAQPPDFRKPRPLVPAPTPTGVTFGLFRDSRVTRMTPWTIREEADGLPTDILPAYIGSGRIGIGLDPSGMQNMDCRVAEAKRWTGVDFEHKDDLYVFQERMVSGHITPRNLMPLARLEYDLSIDGTGIALDGLPGEVVRWTRTVDLRRAVLTTTLDLRAGVRLAIAAFSPQETSQSCFRFTVASLDAKKHAVTLTARAALTLRARNGSGAIAERTGASWTSGGAAFASGSVARQGPRGAWEAYELAWGAAAGPGGTAASAADAVTATFSVTATTRPTHCDVAFWFGSSAAGTTTPEAANAWARAWRSRGWPGLLRAHERDWARWYAAGADLQTGDDTRDTLLHSSLYLLRCGSTYRSGTPLNFLLFHAENWYASTFWDLTFVLDGLLRCNHLEPGRRSLAWLHGVMAPQGRPFHWLTRYDGTSGMPPGGADTGYMVSAAHAMAAIRLYEATGDRDLLRGHVYPIVRRVADYAVRDRLVREGDHWIGAGAGLDVNTPMEVNESFSAAWFAVVLRKAAEYAALLGIDAAPRREWAEAATGLRLERSERGYHQSRTVPRPGGWVSMLLYPTEAAPLIDLATFARNRAAQSFLYDYHVHQPWVYFWQAVSDLRTGEDGADLADAHIAEGLKAVHGPGYFAEIVPKDMEGLPPYQSAHGAYLTAVTEQLVSGSVWDDTVRVFVHLPSRLRGRVVRFQRIRTSRGVIASGEWTPGGAWVRLRGSRTVDLRLRVPDALRGGAVAVTVGGRRVRVGSDAGGIVSVRVGLRPGRDVTVWVRRVR